MVVKQDYQKTERTAGMTGVQDVLEAIFRQLGFEAGNFESSGWGPFASARNTDVEVRVLL